VCWVVVCRQDTSTSTVLPVMGTASPNANMQCVQSASVHVFWH
jgi:hypothetical protein